MTDANKSLSFTYDELINKMTMAQKGLVKVIYTYDAAGNKLKKVVNMGRIVVITDYIGSAVYIDDKLSFINQPEGRIRYNASSPTPYIYDYYIKDHLGSTRSVVTYNNGGPITGFTSSAAPSKEVNYLATSEIDQAVKENQLFDNIDQTRAANPNKKTVSDNYVAKLSARSSKTIIGPDITLKVMAGDSVKISAEALVIAEKNNPNEVVTNVINNFVTAFTTPASLLAEGVNTVASSNMKTWLLLF